jgi:antitoxin component YwqK of YwqJK toxin-antitoxin module
LKEKENYTDGKLDGLYEAFDEAGNLTRTETWENGKQIEKTKPLN